MRRRLAPAGIAARLLLAMALVLAAGALTAWIVAAAVGPAVFHDHMVTAGIPASDPAVIHAEEAFRTSSAVSLAIALTVAGAASLAVSYVMTRRIGHSTRVLADAATDVAGGHFDARVGDPRLGAEFTGLTAAFNDMAARLDQSQQMRRRLLSDVAHELRTPVATISVYLDAIEDGIEELDPETVTALRAQGARLARLADDLAAVTRAENAELDLAPVAVNLGDLIAQVAAGFAPQYAERGVHLSIEARPGLSRARLDPERFAQVLANLLENALRHTPPGGVVRVTARDRSPGNVTVEVTDTGSGIEPAHIPHVFERFYRADTARDRSRGGSGIGLAIVKALIEAHGGTVRAASDGTGHGTRFTITLPVAGP